MNTGWLGIPWILWTVACFGIAGLYMVFVPGRAKISTVTGWRFIVLRWFHSFVWDVLAISFFIRTTPLEGLANPIALFAGVLYAVYIATFFQTMKK